MIRIRLLCSSERIFRSCEAVGHAGYAETGRDIVCAGVTSVLRTVLSLLDDNPLISLETDLPERGVLAFRVTGYDKTQEVLLIHCSDFLEKGLKLLSEEYPEYVSLRVQIE